MKRHILENLSKNERAISVEQNPPEGSSNEGEQLEATVAESPTLNGPMKSTPTTKIPSFTYPFLLVGLVMESDQHPPEASSNERRQLEATMDESPTLNESMKRSGKLYTNHNKVFLYLTISPHRVGDGIGPASSRKII